MSTAVKMDALQTDFTMKVLSCVGLAFGVSALGVYLAPIILPESFLSSGGIFAIFILELILIFTSGYWSRFEAPVNYLIYLFFALLSGMATYPLLMMAISVGGTEIVFKALITTVSLSFAAGIFAKTTHYDLSGLRGFFMVALIGLIIVGILQMFWFNSMVELISSGLGILLFSGLIAYDIQMIERYPQDQPIEASIALYLSIFNLFTSVLRFLIAMQSSD